MSAANGAWRGAARRRAARCRRRRRCESTRCMCLCVRRSCQDLQLQLAPRGPELPRDDQRRVGGAASRHEGADAHRGAQRRQVPLPRVHIPQRRGVGARYGAVVARVSAPAWRGDQHNLPRRARRTTRCRGGVPGLRRCTHRVTRCIGVASLHGGAGAACGDPRRRRVCFRCVGSAVCWRVWRVATLSLRVTAFFYCAAVQCRAWVSWRSLRPRSAPLLTGVSCRVACVCAGFYTEEGKVVE